MATREIRKIRLIWLVFTLGLTPLFFPSSANAQVQPQYGGTLTFIMKSEPPHTDPHSDYRAAKAVSGVAEKLGMAKWSVSTNKYNFSAYLPAPGLAESWEQPDPTTYVFYIRQDVHWHDKAPMNGRALKANDIEYNWKRILCLEQKPQCTVQELLRNLLIKSVEARDQWTVEFRLKEPSLTALPLILTSDVGFILPPEVIQPQDNVKDWKNLVGTGPYRLTEWREGTSLTWNKNPNYWGYDTKNPKCRLPYIDKITALIIPEEAARIMAINGQKVDYADVSDDNINNINNSQLWNQVRKLGRTFIYVDTDQAPFDDIRVSEAMQRALDLETINRQKLPMNLYAYNPEKASQLMAEAGYPNGFWTNLKYDEEFDTSFIDSIADSWAEIGIKVESEAAKNVQYMTLSEQNDGGIFLIRGRDSDLLHQPFWDQLQESLRAGDPVFNSRIQTTQTTLKDWQRLVGEADERIREKSWYVESNYYSNNIIRSRVMGYDVNQIFLKDLDNSIFAQFWIDEEKNDEPTDCPEPSS